MSNIDVPNSGKQSPSSRGALSIRRQRQFSSLRSAPLFRLSRYCPLARIRLGAKDLPAAREPSKFVHLVSPYPIVARVDMSQVLGRARSSGA